jgi:AcrR family transcriptional regulator
MTETTPSPTEDLDATPKWRRRPEARPEEILSAALEVIGEVGFAEAKLDDVAHKAGISKGTLYLYFDSKEELFREMVRNRIGARVAVTEERVNAFQGPAREALALFIKSGWDEIRRADMVRIARLIHAEQDRFPELARFYFDEVVLRTRVLARGIIQRGIASGEFRPSALGFAERAIPSLLVHGAMFRRCFGRFDSEPMTEEQLVEGVIDFALHGVLAATPAARAPQGKD